MTRACRRNDEVVVLERPLDLIEDLGTDHLVVVEIDIPALVGILNPVDELIGQVVRMVAQEVDAAGLDFLYGTQTA